MSITWPNLNNQRAMLFIVIYRPPGPYTEFLNEFSDFLSNLVLNWERIVIVGDFNIHVDNDNDSLSKAFAALLDGIGFTQERGQTNSHSQSHPRSCSVLWCSNHHDRYSSSKSYYIRPLFH